MKENNFKDIYEYKSFESSKINILIDKKNKLSKFYEPNDLVEIEEFISLRKEAAEAFKELLKEAHKNNIYIYPFSGYRTFKKQRSIYKKYVNKDGIEKADTYSARPGHSEHQTGLAVDVRSQNLTDNITEEDYEWLLNNAHKFGFIIRYPKGKEDITGYIEEPWHLRYLGVLLANEVYNSNLTFDEYYTKYIQNN